MPVGRGFTAARRRASRLAGLVRLPAVWPIQTAIRRQASWLAAKASMILTSRWPFALQKFSNHNEASQPARAAYAPTNYESEFPPAYQRRKIFQPHLSIPTCKGCVCPTPTAGEQSGDRQRREKGPPILSAEKGEHERAPPLCVSYPAPLRATLRAPPSKWAIGAFFPESPCRWLSFAYFSFAIERKV